jgi:hypothetical protein
LLRHYTQNIDTLEVCNERKSREREQRERERERERESRERERERERESRERERERELLPWNGSESSSGSMPSSSRR